MDTIAPRQSVCTYGDFFCLRVDNTYYLSLPNNMQLHLLHMILKNSCLYLIRFCDYADIFDNTNLEGISPSRLNPKTRFMVLKYTGLQPLDLSNLLQTLYFYQREGC